ncbi:MAG TPA: 50S ribosomal protein L4 [Patescibacteria group bacterium]|nr:50S ribosomal protein L4 [Patescibacteria group bacterium]
MKNLKIAIINSQGEVAGEAVFAPAASEVSGKVNLVTQAVRVFLANQRRARAHAKTRGEVSGSTAKIWRQKGTGRARHGDRQAPIFVGGGVAHGPTGGQNYHQKLNRKMGRRAILAVLAEKAKEKKIYLVKDLNLKKTKEAAAFLAKVRQSLKSEGKIVFLLAKGEEGRLALRNLKAVTVSNTESLNPYFLLLADLVLITEAALKALEARFNGRRGVDE